MGLWHLGCGGTAIRQVRRTQTFRPAEVAPYRRSGTASIVGEALGPVRQAGATVIAAPNTAYLCEEVFNNLLANDTFTTAADPRAVYWRAQADAQGRFVFEGLPPGQYLVATVFVQPRTVWNPRWRHQTTYLARQLAYTVVDLADGGAATVRLH